MSFDVNKKNMGDIVSEQPSINATKPETNTKEIKGLKSPNTGKRELSPSEEFQKVVDSYVEEIGEKEDKVSRSLQDVSKEITNIKDEVTRAKRINFPYISSFQHQF